MPTETLNYLRFIYRFPVIAVLWKYLAALAIYTTIVVMYTDVPSQADRGPRPAPGAETILTGVIFGWLMSFRTTNAYARWWEGRVLWGQLVNECRNLYLKTVHLMKADAETCAKVGALLVRFAESLRIHLRNTPPREPGMPLPPRGPHEPMAIAGQVYELLNAGREAGRVDGWAFLSLDRHARELMNVCGACERIKNTPLTASYRGLLRKGITAYMLVLPWLTVRDLGWGAVPVVVLIGYALIGLELIAGSIENPFGHDGDDLPLDEIVETIRRSVTPAETS